jgi:hypothetical protein
MSQQFTIGKEISVRVLRDYVIEHKVNKGDSIVLSALNYEHILEEMRHSGEQIPVPLEILGVRILKDNMNSVETGKIQIVKNEHLNQ